MKTFILTLLLFSGSITVFAGKPPESVAKAFKQKFPSAINIKWVKERDNFWLASFNINNRKASVKYTIDGYWIWAEMEKPYSELRVEIRDAIKRDYGPWCTILSIYLQEWVGCGSQYVVKMTCGNGIDESVYDEKGWLPPRI
jgi:hypothetical protein